MRECRDLDRLVLGYFAEKREFGRLAAVALAEQVANVRWRTELLARRRAADDALAAARASLCITRTASTSRLMTTVGEVRLHTAIDRRDDVHRLVAAEISRLHGARRDRLAQLMRQLHNVSVAKDALLSSASQITDIDVATVHAIARHELLERHYPSGAADGFLVDEPLVAAVSSDTDDAVLVHLETDENATVAEGALTAAGVRVHRDPTFDPSGRNGSAWLRSWVLPPRDGGTGCSFTVPPPTLSALSGDAEFGDKLLDAAPDVVADAAYGVDALSGRVVEVPVQVPLSGEDGQASPQPIDTSTSEVSRSRRRVSAGLAGDVDADLAHRLHGDGVDPVGRFGPGGADLDESPARCSSQPAAIWDRPALCTQTNRTLGFGHRASPRRRQRDHASSAAVRPDTAPARGPHPRRARRVGPRRTPARTRGRCRRRCR